MVACQAPGPQEKVEWTYFAPAQGGSSYSISFGITDLINKNHPWIHMSFQETKGAGDAGKWADSLPAEQRRRSIVPPADTSYWNMLDGRGGFPHLTDLRILFPMNIAATGIVTFDPNIKTIADLAGKTLAATSKTHGGWAQQEPAFKSAGVIDKVTFKYLGFGPAADALRDGLVDAATEPALGTPTGGWLAAAPIRQLQATKKVYFVAFPDHRAEWLKMTGRPYNWTVIPAGAIGNDAAVGWPMMNASQYAVFADADVDEVYEITKLVMDRIAELETYHITMKGLTAEWVASHYNVASLDEIHPGVLKYWKERGLEIPLAKK